MRIVATIGLLVLCGSFAQSQDEPKLKHTSTDAYKCKACAPALGKALAFLKKKGTGADVHRQCLMGFVYMASGRHPSELQRCVKRAMSGWKGGGFNGNWSIAMCAIFLSEYYKRTRDEKVGTTLIKLVAHAVTQVDEKGGWSHNPGFEYGQGERATVDLGILTAMMFAAMLNMKASGLKVDPALLKKTQDNLEAISDGMGISYGTGNRAGDRAMSRGAWAYLGIHFAKYTSTKFWKSVPNGLKSKYKNTDDGHAYPPLHYHAVALALHLLGAPSYDKFFKHWADKLIGLQKEDGSIELPHSESIRIQGDDGYVGSTASLALILLLQKPGLMKPGKKKKGGGGIGEDVASGGGIFGGKSKNTSNEAPYMGVRVKKSGFGLSVTSVKDGSAGDEAGVQKGDLILSFNGKTFDGLEELRELVAKSASGKKVTLAILRAGDKRVLKGTMGGLKKSSLGTVSIKSDEF